jgi:hypothetical protein
MNVKAGKMPVFVCSTGWLFACRPKRLHLLLNSNNHQQEKREEEEHGLKEDKETEEEEEWTRKNPATQRPIKMAPEWKGGR